MKRLALALALVANIASAQIVDPIFNSPAGVGKPIFQQFQTETVSYLLTHFGVAPAGITYLYTISTTGTTAAVTMTGTRYGQIPRSRISTTGASNLIATINETALTGKLSLSTGFRITIRVGFPLGLVAGHRALVGIVGNAQVIAATDDPANYLNTIYFGFSSADTTWHICSNDGVGTATCADLGLAISTVGMFRVQFEVAGSIVNYSVVQEDVDGVSFIGTIAADLPAGSTILRAAHAAWTGATTTAVVMETGSVVTVLPY